MTSSHQIPQTNPMGGPIPYGGPMMNPMMGHMHMPPYMAGPSGMVGPPMGHPAMPPGVVPPQMPPQPAPTKSLFQSTPVCNTVSAHSRKICYINDT